MIASAQANVLDLDGGKYTTVGIFIREISTGKVVADHNSYLAMTPASTTKTLTSATALGMLGPDFRFATRIELSGARSGSDRSLWQGNLIIRSCGDPTVESPDLKQAAGMTDSIVASLRRMGISRISGAIVIDQTMADPGPVQQWEVEDLAWAYGAGLYGFNYASNCVKVYPVKGTTSPASNIKVTLRASRGDGTNQIRGWGDNKLYVWAPAKNRSNANWNITTTNPDPAYTYTAVLTSRLASAGIKIGAKKADVPSDNCTEVYMHYSPKLPVILRSLMKRSDNLFAEGVLRAIQPDGSLSDCLDAEANYWKSCGVPMTYTKVYDGSGLTRANRLSPRFLADMLTYMATSDMADTYVDFFPVAGVDGTMKSFAEKSPLKGRLALKTGSVSSVQCYAGYKLNGQGKPTHVVVIMVNGFFCSRASLRKKTEQYLLNIFPN